MYVVNKNELYHHGIKGQKWGVRRYQNADGSLTAAGRKKYAVYDNSKKEKGEAKSGQSRSLDRKKIAKTALAVGGAALLAGGTYAALKNPKSREAIAKAAKKAMPTREGINKVAKKVAPVMKDYGKKTLKEVGSTVHNAGKAAAEGAMASIAMIQMAKVAKKYSSDSDSDIITRNTINSAIGATASQAMQKREQQQAQINKYNTRTDTSYDLTNENLTDEERRKKYH